jgi:uncharacterized Fe-S center protein
MRKVYFLGMDSHSDTQRVSSGAEELLDRIVKEENISLEKEVPLKVHFGEKGNITFIRPENYQGIIDFLSKRKIKTFFTDTNALYRGARTTEKDHKAIAEEHGFTQIPVRIADGNTGEKVEINKKHFRECKIGKLIADHKQLIIVTHFKGHMLTGFGGAIKQLGMGCAARGGKLDQHCNNHPTLNPLKCKKCGTCVKHCPVGAITLGKIPRVDTKKCIGCAGCIAVCPHGAMSINWFSTRPKTFHEKLAEYAFAAQKDKKNIYITFAFNITDRCDCLGEKLKIKTPDLGILASTDPVAIDTACMDLLKKREGKDVFKGRDVLDYAESIGLGSKSYELVEV